MIFEVNPPYGQSDFTVNSENISNLFDSWDDAVVHLLPLKSSMVQPISQFSSSTHNGLSWCETDLAVSV